MELLSQHQQSRADLGQCCLACQGKALGGPFAEFFRPVRHQPHARQPQPNKIRDTYSFQKIRTDSKWASDARESLSRNHAALAGGEGGSDCAPVIEPKAAKARQLQRRMAQVET